MVFPRFFRLGSSDAKIVFTSRVSGTYSTYTCNTVDRERVWTQLYIPLVGKLLICRARKQFDSACQSAGLLCAQSEELHWGPFRHYRMLLALISNQRRKTDAGCRLQVLFLILEVARWSEDFVLSVIRIIGCNPRSLRSPEQGNNMHVAEIFCLQLCFKGSKVAVNTIAQKCHETLRSAVGSQPHINSIYKLSIAEI